MQVVDPVILPADLAQQLLDYLQDVYTDGRWHSRCVLRSEPPCHDDGSCACVRCRLLRAVEPAR